MTVSARSALGEWMPPCQVPGGFPREWPTGRPVWVEADGWFARLFPGEPARRADWRRKDAPRLVAPDAAVADAPKPRAGASAPAATSPSPTRSALPPVAGAIVSDHSRRDLDVSQAAELPELLGCSGVLKDEFVDFERVEFTGLEALDGQLDLAYELAELFLVKGRNGVAGGATV